MSDLSWKDGIYRAGAVQAGYIEEVVGLHPELYFQYRVKSPPECERLITSAIIKDTAKALVDRYAIILSGIDNRPSTGIVGAPSGIFRLANENVYVLVPSLIASDAAAPARAARYKVKLFERLLVASRKSNVMSSMTSMLPASYRVGVNEVSIVGIKLLLIVRVMLCGVYAVPE